MSLRVSVLNLFPVAKNKMKASATNRQKRRTRLIIVGIALGAFLLTVRMPSPMAAPINQQTVAPEESAYLTPVEIKLSADGKRLYVVCEDGDSLLAVDTETKQVVQSVKVGHKPKGLAISPDGKSLYVSNEWSDTVSEIDAATFTVKRTLKTGWGPVGLVTDRAGKTLYVANSIADSVSLIDLATGEEIKRFVTHRYPEQMMLSRDGRRVYVSNILPHLGPYDQPPVSELLSLDTGQAGGGGAHPDSRLDRTAPHRRSAARSGRISACSA